MADIDRGIKEVARTSGQQLARLAGVKCQEWAPIESTLQATTERLADRVFRARRGRQRFVVYMEFYTDWNRNAPWEVLEKSGMLSRREQLPTVSLLFILRRRGYRSQKGQLRLSVGGKPTQHLWFQEVPLWQQEPEGWWEQAPGLMTLYPLCRHQRTPQDAIRHAATVIEGREADPGRRADHLVILNLFGELGYPRLNVARIIGREKMKASKLFQEVQTEERRETRRADILLVLTARFGPAGIPEVAAALHEVEEVEMLDRFIERAATCSSVDEFRDALLQR
jgi:hypothetical protein